MGTEKRKRDSTKKKTFKKLKSQQERSRAKRDKPLTAFAPEPIVGHPDPETGEIPLEDFCRKLRESRFRNDEGLRLLVQHYLDELGKSHQERAIIALWQLVSDLMQGSDPYFTEDNFKKLQDALLGDIPAAQELIKANPEVIRLPFIADILISILNDYKHKTNLKETDIKEQWQGFMPSREKNVIPYSDEELKYAFEIAKKDKSIRTTQEAREKLSQHLDISERKLIDIIKIKKSKGRPSKK